MEWGTPGGVLEDGWCNRSLQRAATDESPVRALAFGVSLPQAPLGRVPSVALNNLSVIRRQETEVVTLT